MLLFGTHRLYAAKATHDYCITIKQDNSPLPYKRADIDYLEITNKRASMYDMHNENLHSISINSDHMLEYKDKHNTHVPAWCILSSRVHYRVFTTTSCCVLSVFIIEIVHSQLTSLNNLLLVQQVKHHSHRHTWLKSSHGVGELDSLYKSWQGSYNIMCLNCLTFQTCR